MRQRAVHEKLYEIVYDRGSDRDAKEAHPRTDQKQQPRCDDGEDARRQTVQEQRDVSPRTGFRSRCAPRPRAGRPAVRKRSAPTGKRGSRSPISRQAGRAAGAGTPTERRQARAPRAGRVRRSFFPFGFPSFYPCAQYTKRAEKSQTKR